GGLDRALIVAQAPAGRQCRSLNSGSVAEISELEVGWRFPHQQVELESGGGQRRMAAMNVQLKSHPDTARVERLSSVDGLIAYDIPSAPVSGGGTRLAPDITEAEMLLLARAMTYKLGRIGLP